MTKLQLVRMLEIYALNDCMASANDFIAPRIIEDGTQVIQYQLLMVLSEPQSSFINSGNYEKKIR